MESVMAVREERLTIAPGVEARRSGPGTSVARVGPDLLESFLHPLSEIPGGRLADFFGDLEDGELLLRLVYGLDRDSEYLVLEWPVSHHDYPSLSDVAPGAFVEECEIYEQFGVRPSGSRPLNRLVVPPHASRDFPRLGEHPSHEGREPHAPHYVSGEAFEFPFGPVRAVAQESLYVGLVTSGEEVIDLYLLQWHKHRGIEQRLRGTTAEEALFVVERAEGLSAVGNGWAFCRAVESIGAVQIPERAEPVRVLALELERLYNHTAAIATLCQATGLSVGQAQAEIALEQFLRLNLAVFGHRYLFGVLAIGGVARWPDVSALHELLPVAYKELRRVIDALWSTNSFMDRLEACGVVTSETAARLGLVGPVARASGQDFDSRRDHTWGVYSGLDLDVPVEPRGDVLARMRVFSAEVEASRRVIDQLMAADLGAQSVASQGHRQIRARPGALSVESDGAVVDVPRGEGTALGWSESPRGESLVWLGLDGEGRVRRVRLRPGSARNWRAFDDAARSRNVFTDIPIIEASFWLTVAGLAR